MFNKRFGIELEIVGLNGMQAAAIIRNAGYSCEYEGYNHTDHANAWKVVTDSSISGTGCEVVSPILSGESGLADARKVAEALEAAGATANRSCGFHVHFDASQMTVEDVRAVFTRYAKFEAEIDAFMPMSRRADNNRYCHTIAYITERVCAKQTLAEMAIAQGSRYYKLNFQSYLRHHTIEFRQHSGTCSAAKIANWVLFLSDFIDAATRQDEFVAKLQGWPTWSKIWNQIKCNSGRTIAEHAEALAITPAGLRGQISRMRKAGCKNICTSGNTYVFTATGTADSGIFDGVRESVKVFYEARKIQLAA